MKSRFLKFSMAILLLASFVLDASCQLVCISGLELRDSVYYLNNNPYSGEYSCSDNQGRIIARGFIRHGRLDSLSYNYDESGRLKASFLYFRGKVVERMVCSDELLYRTCETYRGDVLHGLWEKYFKDGPIKERRYYENGEPAGVWTIWDKKGMPFVETTFGVDSMMRITHQFSKRKHVILVEKSSKKRPLVVKREKIIKRMDE